MIETHFTQHQVIRIDNGQEKQITGRTERKKKYAETKTRNNKNKSPFENMRHFFIII